MSNLWTPIRMKLTASKVFRDIMKKVSDIVSQLKYNTYSLEH